MHTYSGCGYLNVQICILVRYIVIYMFEMVWACFRICNNFLSLSAFTAEQYQQHQEELALMQKQQLEQVQLQQQTNSTANSTQVSVLPVEHRSFILSALSSVLQWLKAFSSVLAEPGKHVGPGQRSVCCLGPRHRRPTAGFENQGGASPGRWSQRRPLPLRYDNVQAITGWASFYKVL